MENIDRLVQLITDRLLEKMTDKPECGSVYLLGKESTKECLVNHGFAITDQVGEADHIVVDCLSVDAFLRLANLCPTTSEEGHLLTALLTGKKVLVASETLGLDAYKRTASPLLYRNLLKQKETLEKYGVRFYHEDQLLSILAPEKEKPQRFTPSWRQEVQDTKPVPTRERSYASTHSAKRVLITETKIKEMGLVDGDTFKVEKGMIITALAKDYLNRHHITIVE